MSNYKKETKGNKIIFKDEDLELSVTHYDEDYISDTILLDDRYSIDFISYIVESLKESGDLLTLDVLFDSKELEKVLENHGLKISNYEYRIKSSTGLVNVGKKKYEVDSFLDEEAKEYYLGKINEATKINHSYYNPKQKVSFYTEKVFEVGEYSYLVYKENGKIVGIVDYKVFSCDLSSKPVHDIYDYSNKVCVRSIFGENEMVMIYILNDLLKRFGKDIIISVTYTEKNLREAIVSCGGEFKRCLYILIQ